MKLRLLGQSGSEAEDFDLFLAKAPLHALHMKFIQATELEGGGTSSKTIFMMQILLL